MGTPKKKEMWHGEVVSPTLGEKIRLFEIGKMVGQALALQYIPELLEEIKTLLLPSVQWLDKPLTDVCPVPVIRPNAPKGLNKTRVIKLYFGESTSTRIWLERSGGWLVWLSWPQDNPNYHRVNSGQLAQIIVQEAERYPGPSGLKGLLEEVPFIREIALYNAVRNILAQFFVKVREVLDERKRRLNSIENRLDLGDEFVKSFDPLIGQGKTVKMKEYSIWREHEHGGHGSITVDTDCYLCPEALKPFWDEIKSRRQDVSDYKEHAGEYHFNSLFQFLDRLAYIFREIQKERDRKKTPGISWKTGRLPFSEGELKAVEEAIKSITAKE